MRTAATLAATSKANRMSRPADSVTRADRACSANISFPSVSLATISANPVPRTSTSFTTMLAKCENESVTEETVQAATSAHTSGLCCRLIELCPITMNGYIGLLASPQDWERGHWDRMRETVILY